MMTLVFAMIVLFIGMFIIAWTYPEKPKSGITLFVAFLCIYISIVLFISFTKAETQKSLLDHLNPYKKEYVYKQNSAGEYVKTDSIYIKIKNVK